MNEFELMAKLQEYLLLNAERPTAARILKYLTDWNASRPLPPASET